MIYANGLSKAALEGLTYFATYYGCKTAIEAIALADYIASSRLQSLEAYLTSMLECVPQSVIL